MYQPLLQNGSCGHLPLKTSMDDLVSDYNKGLFAQRRMLFQEIEKKAEDLKYILLEKSDGFNTSDVEWLDSAYVRSLDEDEEIEKRVAFNYDKLLNEIEAESKGILQPNTTLTVADILQTARPSRRLRDVQHGDALVQLLAREAAARSHQDSSQESPSGRFGDPIRRGRPPRRPLPTSRSRRPPVRRDDEEKPLSHQAQQKHQESHKTRQLNWPSADYGFFCLLRGFLTQNGGERRRLTTAQLCEYVREWQAQNARQLLRAGSNLFTWIRRSEDWSAVTPHVLQFLTGESVPLPSPGAGGSGSSSRHSSRRLTCPRPFVNSRPRVHQWSWLLAPGSANSGDGGERFAGETEDLERLFSDWVRAPRGLGGLADAEWMVASAQSEQHRKPRGRRSHKGREGSPAGRPGSSADSNSELTDYEDGEEAVAMRPLKIVDEFCSHDEEKDEEAPTGSSGRAAGRKKAREPKARKSGKPGNSGHPRTGSPVDTSVPPPLHPTTCRVRPFTDEEKYAFQLQEHERFVRPWAPFVYRLPEHMAVVGPLRAAPGSKDPRRSEVASPASSAANIAGYRARDHPLLRSDRPLLASLAEIVRDAVACLPNGEGSRADITTLVKHSGFLIPNANPRQLQQCVSSALDRLQGEAPDPSVYFNASRRLWVYRHRHRTPDEFAELHERRRAVLEAKKQVQRGDSQVTTASKRRLSAGKPRARGQSRCSQLAGRHLSQFPRYSADFDLGPGSEVSSVNRGDVEEELEEEDEREHQQEVEMEDSESYIPDIEELEAADLLRASTSGVVQVDSDEDEEDEEDDVDDYDNIGSGEQRVLTRYHRADSHLRAAQGFHDLGGGYANDGYGDELDDIELPAMANVAGGRTMSARFGHHDQAAVLSRRSNPVGRRGERSSVTVGVGSQFTGYAADGYETVGRSQLRFLDADDFDISPFVGFPHPQASEPRDLGNYPYSAGGHHF